MAYPNHINASGIWKLKNLHSNVADGTFPEASEGNRGIFAGGGTITNVIDYIEISSLGNAADFGDLAVACNGAEGISSKVRTLFTGGYEPGVQYSTRMQYITPQTQGNTTDFGDMTESGYGTGVNNDTRGVIHTGNNTPGTSTSQVMEYFTFATTGDASDFGDLVGDGRYSSVGFGDGKRGFFAGGRNPSDEVHNAIEYTDIVTSGDFVDFGDLTVSRHMYGCSGASNNNAGLSDTARA